MATDFREQIGDEQQAALVAIDSALAGVWTALPGIIQSFDADAITAVVQPAIQGIVQRPDGSYQAVNLPLLLDVPVVFPRGGGCTLTFPITGGDECLVVFASRCIDAWWQSGGVQIPMEMRMHDLSDGFALPGPFSQAQKISNISTTSTQLRSNDGKSYVELNPSAHIVNIVAPGGVKITAPTVEMTGNLIVDQNATVQELLTYNGGMVGNNSGSGAVATINGSMTATGTITGQTDVVGGGKSLKGHTHTAQGATAVTTAPN